MFLIRNHRNPQYPIAERSIGEMMKNLKLIKANGNATKEQVADRIEKRLLEWNLNKQLRFEVI